MKYGRLFLAGIGLTLIVTGVGVAVAASVVGLGITAIGLVAVVLGASDWHEFEAQFSALRLRVAAAPPSPVAPQVEARRPDVRILGEIEAKGGNGDHVDFSLEVANYGTQQCRCTVRAHVDGTEVTCRPSTLDLIPNDPGGPKLVRVLVPRKALGDLLDPEVPNHTTLYDRTLTLVVSNGESVTRTWHEEVFDSITDRARWEIQQHYWRRGRGEETADDLRADALREHEKRIESGDDDPGRYLHV